MPPNWRPALLSPATSPAPYTTSPLKPLTTGEIYLTVLSMRLALLPVVAIRFLVSPAVPEPKGSIAATARYCGVYWRPSSKVPLLLCKPTYAWRPNSKPPCQVEPVSPWKPFSSRKMADVPPPRSSLPLKPRREPDSTPLVSLLVVAMPPLSRTSAISKMPYTVTFDCAAAVPAVAPSTSASIVFFIFYPQLNRLEKTGAAGAQLSHPVVHALHQVPKPPPPGVSIANTSPACMSVVWVAPKVSSVPSPRSTQLRPSAPGCAPCTPNGAMRRWPARMLAVIAARKRMRRSAPSPPRCAPLPPLPLRIAWVSTSTGKRHSSTSGSVMRELVIWVCTAAVPSKPGPGPEPPAMVS